MKKIFSFVIVLAAFTMVSCGGNATKKDAGATEATDATRTEQCCAEGAEGACANLEGECCKDKAVEAAAEVAPVVEETK